MKKYLLMALTALIALTSCSVSINTAARYEDGLYYRNESPMSHSNNELLAELTQETAGSVTL